MKPVSHSTRYAIGKTVQRRSESRKKALEILLAASIPVTEKGCWLWNGAVAKNGYGFIAIQDGMRTQMFKVHCLSYEHYRRQRTPGLCLRHTCDVRRCWNPEHLVEGTRRENTQDMISRGRAHWQAAKPHTQQCLVGTMSAPPRPMSEIAQNVMRNEQARRRLVTA